MSARSEFFQYQTSISAHVRACWYQLGVLKRTVFRAF